MLDSTRTVAQELARALAQLGVRYAFGMPGGVLLPLLDAFRKEGIEFVLVRHEGSAGFMADVCAQLTGVPGVCVATLGPGVTNLVSPVAGAHLERSRVLAITGQIRSDLIGTYTHQIVDQVALFEPITRHAVLLTENGYSNQLHDVFRVLLGEHPGPVHLDIPAELWSKPMAPIDSSVQPSLQESSTSEMDVVSAHFARAKRPVILVGLADMGPEAAQAITRLAEVSSVPVMTTYRAKGMIDERHPWAAGAFGLSPVVDEYQQRLLATSDLLIAIGLDPVELRPQWLPGWPADVPLISVNSSTDIPHPVSAGFTGSTSTIVESFVDQGGIVSSSWTVQDVAEHVAQWAGVFDDGPDGPAATIRAIQRGMGPQAVCSMDVGAHRITASHVWTCSEPLQQVQSNGFSSMGTGLPGAIAAKLCFPDRPVVALTGDMGLWMALGELGVVQERGLDLVVVYLADQSLSLIELKQERSDLVNHGVRFENPDVIALGAAFGGVGHRVRGVQDVETVVRQARESGGLHIIEAVIDASPYRRQM
ncbi:MAG: thiamine pyrophosphate-binding protein [Myxococcota bacterium]